ncbi:MAG: hypothetical protein CO108_21845, partial [Deltaproteobacteria bacterium CG_4_9_14_3_um_filter_63_12]
DITIRNCLIGGTGQEFWEGMRVFNGTAVRLLDSELDNNRLEVISGTGLEIARNTFLSLGGVALAITEDATNIGVHHNIVDGRPEDELRGIELWGMVGESGPLPVSGLSIHDNTIAATVGIFMKRTGDSLLVGNDITAWTGFELESSVGANKFRWNNLEVQVGVVADEPTEITDGEGHGNWWGHDCPELSFVAGVDSNRVDVVDSFAYGRRDAWELGLAPGCDTTPPLPPIIVSPQEGVSVLTTPVLMITAEPQAQVRVFEGATEIGTTYAATNGTFLVVLEPLEPGLHVLRATATERAGNESNSSLPRSFTLLPATDVTPLTGDQGKFDIVEISQSLNPFDPSREANKVRLSVKLDGVNGLGGNSQNHRFFVLVERTLLEPETLLPIRTVYGAAEIDREAVGPLRVEVSDEWDGRDEAGDLVTSKPYPSVLLVKVGRLYTGNGQGPPCGRGVDEVLTEAQANALGAKLTLPPGWPVLGKSACMVDAKALPGGSDSVGLGPTFPFTPETGRTGVLRVGLTLALAELSAGTLGTLDVTVESLSVLGEQLAARWVVPPEFELMATEVIATHQSGERRVPITRSDLFFGEQWLIHDTIGPEEVVVYRVPVRAGSGLEPAASGCDVTVLTFDSHGLPNPDVASADLEFIVDTNGVRSARLGEVDRLQKTLLIGELRATGFLDAGVWGEPIDLSNAVLGLSLGARPVEPVGVRRPSPEAWAADPFSPPLTIVDRWEALATPAFVLEQAAGGQVMPLPLITN